MDRQDRIQGGLLGLLIGDALGVPYEFQDAANLPPIAEIEMTPPLGFRRSHGAVQPGTWSDDGAQALCLLTSLLDCGQLDPDDLGQRFVTWYQSGYMALDNHVFDVGVHTSVVLQAIATGMPALDAGAMGQDARGNGSLMRSLPLVLWHQGSDAALVADAHLQSQVTHGDAYCQVCCALYCLWARRLLERVPFPWSEATRALRAIYQQNPTFLDILDWAVRPDDRAEGQGSGYVIDALRSARMVMRSGRYEQVVKAAIALGNDTDTTACIAGGVAGIRDGLSAIPSRWIEQLRGQEIVLPLLERLLERCV
ncbi:ADP-ribosylglycohydrolase family protein [filamentous cyanobacterium LEGE 11480]|uniref:ADP-ribosylglycohydrolase family protein n=1 Tax=Romeriopsis navalis LEGE 11480 TaxID=2777977 RepID=A0A928Z3I6_9CYAN|nr:ADP-ribosylglycohydrolase family protein [Romeriopsis navalis]MBE9029253.1 ADP-ribosylglycohydrolase family protein [Romeriopsis navalis LEGE 11480]